jgi:DNA-binding NarL/FixJ family response regulator
MIRVMLVDDHEILRTGIRAVFELEDDIEVVAEAADGPGALVEAKKARPDVVLMDIRMGTGDGITACRELKAEVPETRVLMLTSFGTEEAVLSSLMAGASGFLLKNTGRDGLLNAVRTVATGGSLLDPAVTGAMVQKLVALATQTGPDELSELTGREREVLALVAKGRTNREIAADLVISEATARNHISHIFEKLGLSRRSEAAALATRLGLGQSPQE